MISTTSRAAGCRGPRRFLSACLAVASFLVACCAEVDQAGNSLYDSTFGKARQRRVAKDLENLEAGRPLQYHRDVAHLRRVQQTSRD